MDFELQRLKRQFLEHQDFSSLNHYITSLLRLGQNLEAVQFLLEQIVPESWLAAQEVFKNFYRDGFPSLLPDDWRQRRGYSEDVPRFETELNQDGWQVNDNAYAEYVSADDKWHAKSMMNFLENYVAKYGDVDVNRLPLTTNEPLIYGDYGRYAVNWWTNEYPAVKKYRHNPDEELRALERAIQEDPENEELKYRYQRFLLRLTPSIECWWCQGTGKNYSLVCYPCQGQGRRTLEQVNRDLSQNQQDRENMEKYFGNFRSSPDYILSMLSFQHRETRLRIEEKQLKEL